MESGYPSFEFDAEVSADGAITVPRELLARVPADRKVAVTVTAGSVHETLRSRGVSEHEIFTISATQREERASVLEFLAAEGCLAGNATFGRRSR